jgi:hypothetical protein
MPEKEFDLYLSLLSRLLRLSPEQKASIDNELRDHLEARFEELVRKGVPRDEAIQWALDEFGDAAGLAQEFTKLSRRNVRRWIMRCTLATAAMGAVVLLVVNAFLPEQRAVPVAQNVVAQENGAAATAVDAAPAVEEGDVVRIDPAEFLPPQLSQPIDLELVDVPLRDAMELISERIGAPVFLDVRGLSDAGVTTDEAVSEKTSGEPVYLLLERMLRSVGGVPLAWHWEDEILHITTQEAEQEVMFTVSYNIRDLLDGGYDPDSLSETIQECTEGPWQDVDGIGGHPQQFGDVLVVRQTRLVQRQVGALLKALRSAGRERRVLAPEWHGRIEGQLNQNVTIDFDQTPLNDVIMTINESYGTFLQLDSQTLQDAGVTSDQPVTLRLSGQPLRVALKYLLKDLGGVDCTTLIEDGRIWVTTKERADEGLETVVYDVGDIVQGDKQLSEDLADLLMNQTEGPWRAFDGIGGVISIPLPDLFVVRQTRPIHVAIRALLAEPRTAMSQAKAQGKPVVFGADLPDSTETRYYLLTAEMADDLISLLPELVAAGTWSSTVAGDGTVVELSPNGTGTIRKVALGQNWETLGPLMGGRFGGGFFDVPVLYQAIGGNGGAAEPAGTDPNAPKFTPAPEAVLIITHKRSVHREIREFLRKLVSSSPTGEPQSGGFGTWGMSGFGGGGLGGGGGGFGG